MHFEPHIRDTGYDGNTRVHKARNADGSVRSETFYLMGLGDFSILYTTKSRFLVGNDGSMLLSIGKRIGIENPDIEDIRGKERMNGGLTGFKLEISAIAKKTKTIIKILNQSQMIPEKVHSLISQ